MDRRAGRQQHVVRELAGSEIVWLQRSVRGRRMRERRTVLLKVRIEDDHLSTALANNPDRLNEVCVIRYDDCAMN